MDKNVQSLVAELKALRKGDGITLTKLARCARLMEALGCDTAVELRNSLDQVTAPHDALRHAYGYAGDKTLGVLRRRSNFAVSTGIDPKTAYNHENIQITEVALSLVKEPADQYDTLQAYLNLDGREVVSLNAWLCLGDRKWHLKRVELRHVRMVVHRPTVAGYIFTVPSEAEAFTSLSFSATAWPDTEPTPFILVGEHNDRYSPEIERQTQRVLIPYRLTRFSLLFLEQP